MNRVAIVYAARLCGRRHRSIYGGLLACRRVKMLSYCEELTSITPHCLESHQDTAYTLKGVVKSNGLFMQARSKLFCNYLPCELLSVALRS